MKKNILLVFLLLTFSGCAIFEDFGEFADFLEDVGRVAGHFTDSDDDSDSKSSSTSSRQTSSTISSTVESGYDGNYSGRGTVYVHQGTNIRTFRRVSSNIRIQNQRDNSVLVVANINNFGSFRIHGQSRNIRNLQQSRGNERYTFKILRGSGSRFDAELIVEERNNRGRYVLSRKANVSVSK